MGYLLGAGEAVLAEHLPLEQGLRQVYQDPRVWGF